MSFFTQIIARWDEGEGADERGGHLRLAKELGLPAKNVLRWHDMDSIPAGWFVRVASTGICTEAELMRAAEAKERHFAREREFKASERQDAA